MARIRVEFRPGLSEAMGAPANAPLVVDEELAEGQTLRAIIEKIIAGHPEARHRLYDPGKRAFRDDIAIVLNGRLADLVPGGLDAVLRDGDQVLLFPGFAGG